MLAVSGLKKATQQEELARVKQDKKIPEFSLEDGV
jgi:hypothetical protein